MDFVSASLRSMKPTRSHRIRLLATAMRASRLAVIVDDARAQAAAAEGFAVPGDYQVASLLERANGPLSPGDVADALQITRPGVTGRLNRLIGQGVVEVEIDVTDTRRKLLRLTRDGERRCLAARDRAIDGYTTIFNTLSHSELQQLAALLERVLAPIDPPAAKARQPDRRRGAPTERPRGE